MRTRERSNLLAAFSTLSRVLVVIAIVICCQHYTPSIKGLFLT